MSYQVRFAPEAADQVETLHPYISAAATPVIASGHLEAIVDHCEGLGTFPHRGVARDDLRPGLRTMAYRKRVILAFSVDDAMEQVTILGVFYGGQDYESALTEPDD